MFSDGGCHLEDCLQFVGSQRLVVLYSVLKACIGSVLDSFWVLVIFGWRASTLREPKVGGLGWWFGDLNPCFL